MCQDKLKHLADEHTHRTPGNRVICGAAVQHVPRCNSNPFQGGSEVLEITPVLQYIGVAC